MLSMQCTYLSSWVAHDICVCNMATKYQKYIVTVTPESYAKIFEVAQSVETTIVREIQERNEWKNYRLTIASGIDTITKRKETLVAATPALGKKKKQVNYNK